MAKLRNKKTGKECTSREFNTHSLSEIVVYFEDDMDSDFMRNYDVYIRRTGQWKDLLQAFKDRDLITDNYNTCFFEPENEEDRERGFTLY